MSASLIDPPVTPYSPAKEIRAWLKELEAMERDEAVEHELAEAEQWLLEAEARERS